MIIFISFVFCLRVNVLKINRDKFFISNYIVGIKILFYIIFVKIYMLKKFFYFDKSNIVGCYY